MSPKPLSGGWVGRAGWLALLLAASAAAATPAHEFSGTATIVGADALIGRPVQTGDGAEFGRVRDIAIDMESGYIGYVVIAVGGASSDRNLVAVDPRALKPLGDADGRLLLQAGATSLRDARRFGATDWPLRADIVAEPAPAADPALDAAQALATGSATISDGTRTATLSSGDAALDAVEFAPAVEPGEQETWIRWTDTAKPAVE